ncbi:phosphoenolpyruvate--protein phosphotransferase [Mycoplasma capricolum]|uniref:Phosphoenolpyruvate-protein phosphotransferase n=1 Tax=Mycoplasma capricolum subsp. capripneumoniae 87001 TaxID=1124992 RepID=A0A9N7B5Q6_MYCCC|nr:phosphoenolpyruvate--protein phosphotransferase [Mycoplasma capricolum]AJK51268.1 phosphoenolpyruvate-protein phosphotransferase [Mycoplasma capricolum subsp. capripneumoniae 87001]AOQ21981.1 phosphoenolpyruvate--protein phosphotransferase [Mycoplasma capricolum subsp. capripneumoniae M1601]KEY84281.1 Phosphoenolpyruvate-protein phosphotransferase [Mycoplasma capricolum subsp. capripneumoniae 99108]QDL19464.1 phosphoenolpyruvate--protein phosphotransferase [Mycoplasma capricolum subsp. capri
MSKQIKGIAASEGISLARALVIKETKLDIQKQLVSDVDQEIIKLEQAIEKSIADLKKIQQITLKKLGEEKVAIFDAHQDIANDPAIKEEVVELIKKEKVNAEYALFTVSNNYFEMFSQLEDPYFKERSADIKDVSLRIISHILGLEIHDLSTIDKEVIIISDDLTPSETAQLDKKFVKGFLTNVGGRTSHAAIMARSLEIPAILGLKNITELVKTDDLIALDGSSGIVELDLNDDDIKNYQTKVQQYIELKEQLKKFKDEPSLTKDKIKKLIEANIGSTNDIQSVLDSGAEGIGLFRTEFLYMDNDHFPTEEEQFEVYKKVVSQIKHLVVFRTLDIGGDKKLSYFKFDEEMNPFLGYRAIRFTLDRKDIFKDQIRALLRASAFGKLGIMFPMIATIDEFKQAKAFVEECKIELDKEGIKYDKQVQIGMMVEIPSAAILADQFAKYADFFSIGTNDLIQYSFASDRMNQNVSYLYQPLNPSLLRLIQLTISGAHKHNKWVGMCGEMAGDSKALPILLGLDLDAFSMSATSVLKARSLMSKIEFSKAKILANKVLECETNEQVNQLVEDFLNNLD